LYWINTSGCPGGEELGKPIEADEIAEVISQKGLWRADIEKEGLKAPAARGRSGSRRNPSPDRTERHHRGREKRRKNTDDDKLERGKFQ